MSKKPIIVKNAYYRDMKAKQGVARKKQLAPVTAIFDVVCCAAVTYGFCAIIIAAYPNGNQAAIKGDALPDAEYMDMTGIDQGVSDAGLEYFPPEYEEKEIPVPREMPEEIKLKREIHADNREFAAQLEEALTTKGAE